MRPGLFREKALNRLSSPDRLDQMMRITTPRSWLILVALAAVIVAALLWSVIGRVPRTVSGEGLLMHEDGIYTAVAPATGLVVETRVQPGDVVEAGQQIATIDTGSDGIHAATPESSPASQHLVPIISYQAGQVIEVFASIGSIVIPGDPIASLDNESGSIVARLFVADGPGKQVVPGMKVRLAPASVDSAQYGNMIGTVQSVSAFPVTERGLTALLQNDALVQAFLANGPVLMVTVRLEPDGSTPSGLKWSTSDGPPFELTHGTLTSASVVLEEMRPLGLALPGL